LLCRRLSSRLYLPARWPRGSLHVQFVDELEGHPTSKGRRCRLDVRGLLKKFSKVYETVEETERRFTAFVENVAIIEKENAKGNSYKLGINEFADLTAEEFKQQYYGYKPPAQKWGDVPYLGTHEYNANESLASSVDWTQKGKVTPVKNQGQCGSCWAFSTTGSLEGAYAIATGNLVSFSEQQLVDCAKSYGEQGCNGGEMDSAFQYAQKNGLDTEASYPYKAVQGTCQTSSGKVGLPAGAVTGFKDVQHNTQALMSAVALGPVSIAIEADKSVFQLYHSGVLSSACGTTLDHGVLVVGYGTESGQDYWLVKNSWGATWGLSGYIKLLRGKNAQGECGILMQPSYPLVSAKPGPAPGPAPPSPPSPPSPPAPPAGSHYEQPPCQSDEVDVQIQGMKGETCVPECTTTACPTDVPAGTTATPQCVLQDAASGKKYCALTCLFSGCPHPATCEHSGLLGICMYPSPSMSYKDLPMLEPVEKTDTTIVV